MIVAAANKVYTVDITTGAGHGFGLINAVGENAMVFLTLTSEYVYQTVPVTIGDQYTLSYLYGKGGDFFRSRGQEGLVVNTADNSLVASTGYLFPSTANDGSGTDILFPASLTFTATTSSINVEFIINPAM